MSMPPLAAFFVVPQPGFIQLQGEDRLDFLQRQSTNDLRSLQPGQALATVLTSPTARIEDVLLVLPQTDALALLSLPGFNLSTSQFLRKRIFFNDRVRLLDRSQDYFQIWLYGEDLEPVLSILGLRDVRPGEVSVTHWQDAELMLLSLAGFCSPRRYLLGASERLPEIKTAFLQAGVQPLDDVRHEHLRIELGLPAAGHELSGAYTPLEVGLEDLVAENKGCYTGQEVLARQLTYDKVTRALVRLELPAELQVGTPVLVETREIGLITSAANISPDKTLALAVLKKPYHQPGTHVGVALGDTLLPSEVQVW